MVARRCAPRRATCLRTPRRSGSTTAMGTLVNVEGKLVPPEQALVPVLDRGFLYGDSVYEVVRTYGGRPLALERHLLRLERNASPIRLTLPRRTQIESELQRTLVASGHPETHARHAG